MALTWTANLEYDIGSYRVRRDGVQIATVTGTSYTDTGRTNGVAYAYSLEAVDTSLNVSPVSSPAVSATPHDGLPPATPSGFAATGGDQQVVVSWTATADLEVRSYELRRDGALIATPTSSATTYTDTGLVNGVAFAYTLVAVDVAGMRSTAAPASATPQDSVPPTAPTGLMALPGDQRAALSWTPNAEDDIADYLVYRDGVQIAVVPGPGISWVDTGLTNGVEHEYRLAARDESGNVSPLSAVAVRVTAHDGLPPAAPADLAATPADRQIVLSWTASTDLEVRGYELRRDGVLVASFSPGTTSFTDTGLVNGVSYAYDLVAVDVAAEVSAPATVSETPADAVAPAAPTGLVAVPGDAQVELSWQDGGDYDISYSRVFRDGVQVAVVVGSSWTDTGLTNGATYQYEVVAVDTSGNASDPSDPTSAVPRDAVPPAAPTGLATMPGDRQVTLTWDANGEPDAAGYRVWRDGVQVAVVTGTTWTDTGLTNGVTYEYALRAIDTSGNDSATSDPAAETPRDAVDPAAPTGLGVVPSDGEVTLTWDAVVEYDVTGYLVFQDGVQIAATSGTSWTVTGLINGQEYVFTIVAVDSSANESDPSDPVTATPADPPPAAPTGLVAEPGDAEVTLTWDVNGEPDIDGYVLLRDGVEIATLTGTSYVDTDVINGTTYTYTVVAVDAAGGRSPESDPVDATPADAPPVAPTGLVADAGDAEVALTWDVNGEPDIDGYILLRDGVEIATLTGTSYVDTDVINGTTYTYTVVAVDAVGGRSPESDPVDATPVDAPPSAPTDVTASPGDERAVVRWTAAPEADVVAYRVLAEDGTVVAEVTAPATSATVPDLVNGVSYRFTVVAVDAGGNESDPSDEVEVTPVAAPVTVPVEGVGQAGGVAASSDGQHLVIGTRSRLEPSDTNTAYELYVVDRDAGTRRRLVPLSAAATGMTDPTNISAPAISDDGRYVALATTAKLLPADTNTLSDVYRLDTRLWRWELVSVPASGAVSRTVAGTLVQTGASVYAKSPAVAMSADGNVVLFYSARADLLPGDTNAKVDVFAKDMTTRAVTRVSTTATGANLPRVPTGPALALTPDGRFALFPALSGTGPAVLYRKTLTGAGAGTLVAASTVTVSGRVTEFGVFRDAGDIAISDDGRYVAFATAAKLGTTTPTANWTAGLAYRKDLDTETVVALGTGQRTVWEHSVELDPTGRYAYYSTAAPAIAGDTNGHTDFYRRDLDGGVAGPLLLVTGDASGRHTTGPSGSVAATEYGRVVALTGDDVLVTTSQALAPVDANKLRDLYRKDLADGDVRTPLA